MIDDSALTKEFYPIWKKYRPVVLKLMIDSLDGTAQTYQLSRHEYADVNTRKSAVFSFKLATHKGRVLHPKKASVIAADLLVVLKQSAKARELMEASIFHFVLDAKFNLTVSSESPEAPPAPAEQSEEKA